MSNRLPGAMLISGIRTNEERALTAAVFFRSITLARQKVTDCSIQPQLEAGLIWKSSRKPFTNQAA